MRWIFRALPGSKGSAASRSLIRFLLVGVEGPGREIGIDEILQRKTTWRGVCYATASIRISLCQVMHDRIQSVIIHVEA